MNMPDRKFSATLWDAVEKENHAVHAGRISITAAMLNIHCILDAWVKELDEIYTREREKK